MADAQIGALRVSLGIDSAQFSDGLKTASDRLHKFKAVAAGALAVVAAAATSAAVGLGMAVKSAIDAADEMQKASQKFGVPIESLSRLKYAAEMSNVAFETLGTGLRKLAQNMDETATKGSGRAADAFAALGIEVQNIDGTLRTQEDVLGQLATRFAEIPDGARKTALSMAIFGKAGAELIPLLNEGADGIRRFTDEAARFGLTISAKTAAQADEFNDTLDRMRAIWTGLVNQLTARLLPALQTLADRFFRFTSDGNKVQSAFAVIEGIFKGLAEKAYLASTYISVLSKDWTAFVAVLKAPPGEFGAALETLFNTIDEGRERARAAREEMQMFWDTARNGLGSSFGTGWTAPANDNGGGGGLPGYGASDADKRAAEEAERERAQMEAKLERLRESLMTERELEDAIYAERLAKLAEFEAARGGMLADSAELRAKIEQEHADRVEEIQRAGMQANLNAVSNLLGSLTDIMGSEGDKQLGIVKALGIAQALINTYSGITAALADPTVPTFARWVNAAAVAAAGFAQVAKIRSTSKGAGGGGGGGGVSAGGGSSAAAAPAAAAPAQTMFVQGFKSDEFYSGDSVRRIASELIKFQQDGGKVVLAA